MGKGLGKGLETLIPTDFDPSLLIDSNERVQNVFISDIAPNPDQPRKTFDEQALEELARSIKHYGILQPLIVSPHDKGYVIIAGERRWRAAAIAGLEKIPAIIRKPKELEQLEIALIENVQRVDLSPFEQAVSIEKLHTQFNTSYSEIAERLGKAQSTVNNIVRLLQLPADAIKALQNNQITEGHARAVLALKAEPAAQAELLRSIIDNGWSVRQAEQFVVGIREGAITTQTSKKRLATTTPETERLSKYLSTPVSIKRTARGGRLELHFRSDDELQKLIDQLLASD
jgi:ParB family transcriptional regulator, chromosome partitioning protein